MSKHTQGRMCIDGSILFAVDKTSCAGRKSIASVASSEDASRLAACWNACEGVSTEDIEPVSVNTGPLLANKLAEVDAFRAYVGQLQRQRYTLLTQLEKSHKTLNHIAECPVGDGCEDCQMNARHAAADASAAIARAKGGAQ